MLTEQEAEELLKDVPEEVVEAARKSVEGVQDKAQEAFTKVLVSYEEDLTTALNGEDFKKYIMYQTFVADRLIHAVGSAASFPSVPDKARPILATQIELMLETLRDRLADAERENNRSMA